MIDWTDAALEAAFEKLQVDEQKDEWESYIRAALDAAVRAQFRAPPPNYTYQMVYSSGRVAALEEAAKVAESGMLPCDIGGELFLDPFTTSTIATAIRALAKQKPGI